MKFCEICNSLIINEKCSNYKCEKSDGKRLTSGGLNSKSDFLRHKRTGNFMDKDTGLIVQAGR